VEKVYRYAPIVCLHPVQNNRDFGTYGESFPPEQTNKKKHYTTQKTKEMSNTEVKSSKSL
jgi:hypothetical protein